jgi:hypothetical protein
VKGDCLRRSPSAWLSVCSATLVLAVGCGGDGSSSETPQIDRAVAEKLAAQSDAVAAAIEANNGCLAAERIAALRATLDEEDVPREIRSEVERVASREFICVLDEPPPPALPPPRTVPTDPDEEEDGDDDGARGRGHGGKDKKDKKDKKHGHEDDD